MHVSVKPETVDRIAFIKPENVDHVDVNPENIDYVTAKSENIGNTGNSNINTDHTNVTHDTVGDIGHTWSYSRY